MNWAWSAVDWGDIPAWVSGAATVLALVAAAVAAVVANKIYRIESRRDQAVANERRAQQTKETRAQASQVVIWLEETHPGPFRVMYANASGLPIFDISVRLRAAQLDGGTIYRVLPPIKTHMELQNASQRIDSHVLSDQIIAQNTMMSWATGMSEGPIKSVTVGGGEAETIGEMSYVGVDMTFTDTSGNRWRRSGRGPLEQVGTDTDPTHSFVGG